jgi:hypothetical protein
MDKARRHSDLPAPGPMLMDQSGPWNIPTSMNATAIEVGEITYMTGVQKIVEDLQLLGVVEPREITD